jgi:arsenate reductase
MLTVYGIKQCDTCRKAIRWLDAQGLEHHFHDIRADGLEADLVKSWLSSPFAGKLVNRRSTTWRKLSDEQRQFQGGAMLELLLEHPTLVKRPVFATDKIVAVGFNPDVLAEL